MKWDVEKKIICNCKNSDEIVKENKNQAGHYYEERVFWAVYCSWFKSMVTLRKQYLSWLCTAAHPRFNGHFIGNLEHWNFLEIISRDRRNLFQQISRLCERKHTSLYSILTRTKLETTYIMQKVLLFIAIVIALCQGIFPFFQHQMKHRWFSTCVEPKKNI